MACTTSGLVVRFKGPSQQSRPSPVSGSAWRLFACSILLGISALQATAETVVLSEGRVRMPVVVAADAMPEETAAARELARVLGAMSGVDWPIRHESSQGGAGFYVGRTRAAARLLRPLHPAADLLAPEAHELGPDGFRIRTVGERVMIQGATPEATGYAVSWLLQRHAGVRWYSPGPLGEVIPKRSSWTLPELAEVREPAYVSREITGFWGDAGDEWARHNGLRQRIEYCHNLGNVFTPAVYDAHPEWFGMVDGVRRRPYGPKDGNWQPDLARSDVAEYAAAKATEYFSSSPGTPSFSLGMNDTVRFDQGAATEAAVAPLSYFRGMPDYSPLVFGFMNRAASALERTAPGKYLGCLAYFWCENTPPFPVHQRVVPYVTTDRTQFYDTEYRLNDYALMARWGRSGVRAYGLWEYAYGTPYVIPRQASGPLSEALRVGWWRGARGYIADTGPHTGFDAFKVWMLAQLLWEPDRELSELADDFFHGWYGPAAVPMRQFFDRCEDVWMSQSGPPWWIKNYQQADQVRLFAPEMCADLRRLLDEAKRTAASDPAVGARVELTSLAFAVTEAAVAHEARRDEVAGAAGESPVAVGTRLVAWRRSWLAFEHALDTAAAAGAMRQIGSEYLGRNDPAPSLLMALGRTNRDDASAALAELGRAGEQVPAHWAALAGSLGNGRWQRATPLVYNGDFSIGGVEHRPRFLFPLSGELPGGWEVMAAATEKGRVALGTGEDGRRVLRIEGAWDTEIRQGYATANGRLYVAEALVRGRSSIGNDTGICLQFMDSTGAVVGTRRAVHLPKGDNDWRRLVLADVAPVGAKYVAFSFVAARQFGGDWSEISAVQIREVE